LPSPTLVVTGGGGSGPCSFHISRCRVSSAINRRCGGGGGVVGCGWSEKDPPKPNNPSLVGERGSGGFRGHTQSVRLSHREFCSCRLNVWGVGVGVWRRGWRVEFRNSRFRHRDLASRVGGFPGAGNNTSPSPRVRGEVSLFSLGWAGFARLEFQVSWEFMCAFLTLLSHLRSTA
jgi:hypothetical protein